MSTSSPLRAAPRLAMIVGGLLLLAAGCAPPSPIAPPPALPGYHWTDDANALRDLSAQAHAIKNVSAAALLTLTGADGNSVRLDGAIVMSPELGSVRLQAWKFNQTVFDLTLTPRGLWIDTAPGDAQRRAMPASVSAAQLARGLAVFGGEVFDGPGVSIVDRGGRTFEVRKPLDEGQTMIAQIDRSTLTVKRYSLTDAAGRVRFTLTPSHYAHFGGLLWPTHLAARSEFGSIEAELRDVELNGDLPPGVFVPPRRARKAAS